MKKVIKLNESDIRKIVNKSVRRVLCEQEDDFNSKFNKARDNFRGHMFGFEMRNSKREWEYGDVTYDPKTNTMSCMDATIDVDPEMSVDENLEGLYNKLLEMGYYDGE